MSARFTPGELVDVHIKGARIVEVQHPYLVFETDQADAMSVYIDDPQVTAERIAPAEWPPQVGDTWEDATGEAWFTQMHEGDPYLTSTTGGRTWDADDVLKMLGPMTLAYRKGWTPTPAAHVDQADEPKPAEVDERAATIAGLRELADYIECHPDLPVDGYTFDARRYVRHAVGLTTDEARNDELDRLAAIMGVEPMPRDKPPYSGARHRRAVKQFSGGIEYEVILTDAWLDTTDITPSPPEEVAGLVAASPATAPHFELGPLTDEQIDGALVVLAEALDANPELLDDDAEIEAADDREAKRTGGTFTKRYLGPVETDADLLDQLGVAVTGADEVAAFVAVLCSAHNVLGCEECTPGVVVLPQRCGQCGEADPLNLHLLGCDEVDDLRTPDEWQREYPNVQIMDPDGWRGAKGRPWTDPISAEEYLWRRSLCTVTGRVDDTPGGE